MARRSFDVIDVVEILQHWHAGRSKSQVAASVGVDRSTVAKYVARAEADGLLPGGEVLSRAEWAGRVAAWFPELVDAKARSLTFPEINRLRSQIELLLEEVTVTTAWQRLRDEHGLAAGLTSFRRYVALEFGPRRSAGRGTGLRRGLDVSPPLGAPGVGPAPRGGGGRGAAPAGRGRLGGADRLRVSGHVARLCNGSGAAGVGVRDGVGLLPAHVRPRRVQLGR